MDLHAVTPLNEMDPRTPWTQTPLPGSLKLISVLICLREEPKKPKKGRLGRSLTSYLPNCLIPS
jgi:hypothetical protein